MTPNRSSTRPVRARPLPLRPLPFLALVVALAAVMPLRAAAQPVTGIVVERGNGLPVSGAMVMLFDDAGDRVDRFLTNAAGQFRLEARLPGPHYITIERIGYANLTTDRFQPRPHDAPMTIEVPVEPVVLVGLDVEAGQRCEVRPEEGRATARVWDEVRKALAAEAWTREAALYRYTLLRFNRRLDREAETVISDNSALSDERDAAFSSVAIETLAEKGFVQAEGDSATVYYAPDAEALLSDPFLDTHCFGVTAGDEGLIGLTFEPIAGRVVPDIVGVLWVDESTAELDRLVYRYVNLIRSREIGEPGGEVYFSRLPNGAWIVRQWRIRMPVLDMVRRRIVRTAYREEGGFTETITDARDRKVLDARAATVFGVVTDSVGTGPPAVPIGVEIAGTRRFAITDPDGSFLFSELPGGSHALRVMSPIVGTWEIAVPETVVEGEPGEVTYVRLRAPSLADALAHSCGGAPRPEGTAILMGRIARRGGGGAEGLRVRVGWPAATGFAPPRIAAPLRPEGERGPAWQPGREGHYAAWETATDERGLFLVCDAPHGSRLRVAVDGPDGRVPLAATTVFVTPGRRAIVETVLAGPDGLR